MPSSLASLIPSAGASRDVAGADLSGGEPAGNRMAGAIRALSQGRQLVGAWRIGMIFDHFRRRGDIPGAHRPRCALERMRGITPQIDAGRIQNGLQLPDALIGKQSEQFALQITIAGGLARQVDKIDGRVLHRRMPSGQMVSVTSKRRYGK